MAWTTLVNSTTIDAPSVNNNFYHVALGSILPLGGSGMEATTGVYDIGSSTYRWNNIYATNVNLSGSMTVSGNVTVNNLTVSGTLTVSGNQFWRVLAIAEITSATDTIEFTGLSNGQYMFYAYSYKTITVSNDCFMTFNGDTGSSYTYYEINGIWNAGIGGYLTYGLSNAQYIPPYGPAESVTGPVGNYFACINISAIANNYKMVTLKSFSYCPAGSVQSMKILGGVWKTTTALSSIKFDANSSFNVFQPGSKFILFYKS